MAKHNGTITTVPRTNYGLPESYVSDMWSKGLQYYTDRLKPIIPHSDLMVLDLGCGSGQWSAAAARLGATVVACDVNPHRDAIALGRSCSSVHVLAASADQLPFASSTFDAVLCELLLPYVNIQFCLCEVSRVLKPGGVLHGICHGPGYYAMRAVAEARQLRRSARRRLLVLLYTILHRLMKFHRYHYETFQTNAQMRQLLCGQGFSRVTMTLGGHPVIEQRRFMGLACFWEFVAFRDSG